MDNLKDKKLVDLREIAKDLGIESISKYRKDELIKLIEEENKNKEEESQEARENDLGSKFDCDGILEILPDGFGFLRTQLYESGDDDIYVPPKQIKMFRLKTGDYIEGIAREKHDKDKFSPLIFVSSVNGIKPGDAFNRPPFEDLTPIYPNERISVETESKHLSGRIIDIISPIGRGQRGLIVSQPKAGKTTLIKEIERALEKNYDDLKILVLLIDERPEEVTDFIRFVNEYRDPENVLMRTEVAASTFDMPPQNHIDIAEMVLERAKRFVEEKKDVVILLDSITRLARAYNIMTPQSGRTLSGGLDPLALVGPKQFFGAARNIENGGSLTILATALVDTGSRMDDIIFEEFKGTGNMEIHLDRRLSNRRIFPAINIEKSSTRRDDLLLSKEEMEAIYKLRNSDLNTTESILELIDWMKRTKSNEDFVKLINSSLK
ncbi:transcription termination factor Rho [Anaerococcus sp. NML200537]|uniref:transcription termination factor Rho n=1 Tax=Anaerococcus sp. NML200537 TaxID=2954485 RepID=UPI00223724FA|nr:transcription termination factor Rho [Anaerococcus sp. NML200537]MCW6700696.1 transcription termination factor Rho [Anaerococcus sp. NML200537]